MNSVYIDEHFLIEGYYPIESDLNNNKFLWTYDKFVISTKKQNINFFCILFNVQISKDLLVFIEEEFGIIKKELRLEPNIDYILYIKIKNKSVSFYTQPNFPPSNGDMRRLGLYIKKIFIPKNFLVADTMRLFKNSDLKLENLYKNYKEKSVSFDNFLSKTVFEQNSTVKYLSLSNKKSFEFNSSIFQLNDQCYILTRQEKKVLKNTNLNSLHLYKFTDELFNVEKIDLKINDDIEYEQYEDPRVLVHKNNIYVSCSTYDISRKHLIHQKIIVLNENFEHTNTIHPKYGLNGKTVYNNTGIEKNWTYFIHNDRLMCVYEINPHTILEIDSDGNVLSKTISYNNNITKLWKYGELRGGTNPILKDGYYYSFFHSSMPYKNLLRCYFMGYYKFESHPPFKIVEISKEPLLSGNFKDEKIRDEIKYRVVFPMGVILKNNKFLVSFGLNDEKTGLVEINL